MKTYRKRGDILDYVYGFFFFISLQSHQSFLIEAAGEYILFSGAVGE